MRSRDHPRVARPALLRGQRHLVAQVQRQSLGGIDATAIAPVCWAARINAAARSMSPAMLSARARAQPIAEGCHGRPRDAAGGCAPQTACISASASSAAPAAPAIARRSIAAGRHRPRPCAHPSPHRCPRASAPSRCAPFGDDAQAVDRDHGQTRAERQPLRHGTGRAQAGEGPGPRPKAMACRSARSTPAPCSSPRIRGSSCAEAAAPPGPFQVYRPASHCSATAMTSVEVSKASNRAFTAPV